MDASIEKHLREISFYIEEREFFCKSCGCVCTNEEILIAEQLTMQRGKEVVRYRGSCPHCDAFITWMHTKSIERIFWKGQMLPITDFDTDLLMWMLNKNMHSTRINFYIKQVLKGRLVTDFTVNDHKVSNQYMNAKMEFLSKKRKVLDSIENLTKDIMTNGSKYDAAQMKMKQKLLLKYQKRLYKLNHGQTKAETDRIAAETTPENQIGLF